MGLIVEAAQRVGEIAVVAGLGGAAEMTLLAELGALIGELPTDPLGGMVVATGVLPPTPSGLLGEIHHDRPGFEDRDRGTPAHRLVIDDRLHPAVGRNPQKLRRELVAAADVDRLDRVRQPKFLQKNNALFAVYGR